MKETKVTDEQITFPLRLAETERKDEEVCRKIWHAKTYYYNWKKMYGELEVREFSHVKQFDEEAYGIIEPSWKNASGEDLQQPSRD